MDAVRLDWTGLTPRGLPSGLVGEGLGILWCCGWMSVVLVCLRWEEGDGDSDSCRVGVGKTDPSPTRASPEPNKERLS